MKPNANFSKSIFVTIALLLAIGTTTLSRASDIIEVSALTNKILLLHFDDGSMDYPSNTLSSSPLDINAAEITSNYSIRCVEDENYENAQNPVAIGRKTKGTEFKAKSGIPWSSEKNAFDPTDKPWADEHFIYLELPTAMQSGLTYTITTGDLAENGTSWDLRFDESSSRSEAIHVNTLGYGLDAPKYGYIYHWMGTNGGLDLSEYAGNTFSIYSTTDLTTPVKTGTIQFRKSADNIETGQTDDTPDQNFLGAEVYDCNFSDVTTPGNYLLSVEGIGCSYPFKIGTDPIWEAYYNVARALYHQRSGIRLAPPYTADDYIRPVNQNPKVTSDDGTSYAGKQFYSDYAYTDWADANSGGASTADIVAAAEGHPMEIAGWYHDAGDWDSYYTHHRIPILLMTTYEYLPQMFGDDELNLPESGNGVPDLVDEASWLVKLNYRLRKELMARGYSDGGVGGARICSDVYTGYDGKVEGIYPSWQEKRRMVITKADAFMTYFYAGQAAQFAMVLKKVGKNPEKWPVELLDAVKFEDMSYDSVNWINEAEAAFAWASNPDNQPTSGNNYDESLECYQAYAAVNLYRLTGKSAYHKIAKAYLNGLLSKTNLAQDEEWAVCTYLLADNYDCDTNLQNQLKSVVLNTANYRGADQVEKRACRWGNVWDMPMLVNQATTPLMFENILAFALSGNTKYQQTAQTTADYFLGTNPLNTTWITGVGPRGLHAVFHLDSRYIYNDWKTYPGQIPYGPWSMKYGYNPVQWTIDGVEMEGGQGPWDYAWWNFSVWPKVNNWPGHERLTNDIHAPMSMEFTVHQNTVHAAIAYGFVNGRNYNNASSENSINAILLDHDELNFQFKKEEQTIGVRFNTEQPTIGAIHWKSSDESVAYINQFGTITAIANGSCTITCSTLDESASATITVNCNNLADIPVESIEASPKQIILDAGQTQGLNITILPDNATNKDYHWISQDETIAMGTGTSIQGIGPGSTEIYLIADDNAEIADTILVTVIENAVYVIADFETVIPSTEVKPDSSQMFAPGGEINWNTENPLVNETNTSKTVVKYNRPEGTWKLMGFMLPTDYQPRMCEYKTFRFQYYGNDLNRFWVRFTTVDDEETSIWLDVSGTNDWQTASVDLSNKDYLKSIIIFVNPETESPFTCYFDNFELVADETPDCEIVIEPFLIDFENIELNWSAGYGTYGWAGNSVSKADNPMADKSNESGKVFSWERDGTNNYGGFAIVYPEYEISPDQILSFQTYCSQEINSIVFKPIYGDPSEQEAETTIGNLHLTKNYWNTVVVPLSELNAEISLMDRFQMMPAGGTTDAFTFYLDNIRIDPDWIYPETIELNVEDNIELQKGRTKLVDATIKPSDSNNRGLIWKSSNPTCVAIVEDGKLEALEAGEAVITVVAAGNAQVSDQVTINVSGANAIHTVENEPIKIFPNPANETINIVSGIPMLKIELFNLNGQLLKQTTCDRSLRFTWNLNKIKTGLYQLRIHDSKNSPINYPILINQ